MQTLQHVARTGFTTAVWMTLAIGLVSTFAPHSTHLYLYSGLAFAAIVVFFALRVAVDFMASRDAKPGRS
jgi:hypothetical protein